MRHFASDSAESYAVGAVDVARWEQFSLGDELPFQAMWYTVAPRSSSPQDCHPEVELSVVITGTASVEASGRVTDIAAGSCFLLDSEEAHVIHNRTDAPLHVWTTYWMPRETVDPTAVPLARAATDDPAAEVTQ
jgi:mannose-6-phosphate isomerase-like protein (cupin superfamily)